jgi:6-phosphogluconate dehydrogenase
MKLGMIGLGRMGANMVERLVRGGHKIACYDRDPAAIKRVVDKGGIAADSLEKLVRIIVPPRIVWMMVPAGDPVDQTINALIPLLKPGDIIIDGGNSNYKDTMHRAKKVQAKDLHYVDVGTSGGIWGLKEGYSLMIGGEEKIAERLRPIFQTLAPAADRGWGYVGPSGAGHFVKMVHNGIEYGMMEALAEGFAIIDAKKDFAVDATHVAEIWRFGSVVRSWLLDLTAGALERNPKLDGIAPYVADSGEGRWTAIEAIDLNVPAPVITTSLIQRIQSRMVESFSNKLLAAMRHEFGGHEVEKEA